MSDELRNGLWTCFLLSIVGPLKKGHGSNIVGRISEEYFYSKVWISFFKNPIDNMPDVNPGYISSRYKYPIDILREWYYKAEWYRVFDFIEFTVSVFLGLVQHYNTVLEDEMSAYRFIDGVLTQINSEEEVAEIETAIQNLDTTSSARQHLRRSLKLFSDRKNPDYPNSIKESVSSVESVVQNLLGDEKATLGAGLRKLEKEQGLPPTLKKAFSALYGYTSDSGGIRHAMSVGDTPPGRYEARFMLVTCSAFVNYLITKLN